MHLQALTFALCLTVNILDILLYCTGQEQTQEFKCIACSHWSEAVPDTVEEEVDAGAPEAELQPAPGSAHLTEHLGYLRLVDHPYGLA